MRRLPLLALILATSACANPTPTPTPAPAPAPAPARRVTFDTPKGNQVTLDVRIADTPSERQKGLSGVRDLPKDSGMAFLFADFTTDRFWMKDTLIPLSVAFIADDKVVAIKDMVPCTADPCPTYASPVPFTAAIEAPARWYQVRHIGVGSRVTIGATSS